MKYINSKVEKIKFNNFELFLKRDDLLDEDFSGNKARKFYYYLANDFKGITKVIGHGSPQANSLYSFSVLAKIKGWELDFYVDHIPSFIKSNPVGNYKASLVNGANIIAMDEIDCNISAGDYIQEVVLAKEPTAVFVPEGGRCTQAEFGVKILAEEIIYWAKQKNKENVKIVLPSGTGTTALFLQKNLPEFEVLTCACVGGDEYLKKQFFELNSNEKEHPTVLKTQKKYHFGKLYKEFYDMYNNLLKQTDIEFDLLYDPLGFLSLKKYLNEIKNKNLPTILYIHQGGLLGNITMIERYERKYK